MANDGDPNKTYEMKNVRMSSCLPSMRVKINRGWKYQPRELRIELRILSYHVVKSAEGVVHPKINKAYSFSSRSKSVKMSLLCSTHR